MTNVDVDYEDLIDLLGRRITVEEVVDAVTMMGAGPEGVEGNTLTFDIFPSRPDNYSVEGIARSLRGFLGIETGLPRYAAESSGIEFLVDSSVAGVRPYAVGGVVRGIAFTDRLVRSLVDLQEKLHLTLGRRRRKVAIGIHDLDRVEPPFTYKAVGPDGIRFVPLGHAEPMTPAEILARHEKGQEFAWILEGKTQYPMIVDARGEVLSFPPIINGVLTEVREGTKDLFLDVTGTDYDAISGTLNILSTALAERGGRIETVATAYPDGPKTTPDLTPLRRTLRVPASNELIGLDLDAAETAKLLERMRFDAAVRGDTIEVTAPAYRMDLLHEVDLIEDVACAYRFDHIPMTLPRGATIGRPTDGNLFSERLHALLVGYGYQEVLGLTVTSASGSASEPKAVAIENPVQEEYTTLRTNLLPSLLGILRLNRHRDLPQRVYEVGDVVIEARNERRLAAATIHPKASFTEMKSLVLSIGRDVGKAPAVEPATDSHFLRGRCAAVVIDGKEAGRFGEVSPAVLETFGLTNPVAACELRLGSLV